MFIRPIYYSYLFILLTFSLETTSHTWYPWHYGHLRQPAGANYQRNCTLIDCAQKIRETARLAYHTVVRTKANAPKALAAINAQLKTFETELLSAEDAILIAIKKKYAISDELWQECMDNINAIKKNAAIGMTHAYPEVVHDPAIPEDIRTIVIGILEKNDINPQSVSLAMATEAQIDPKSCTLAETTMWVDLADQDTEQCVNTHYIPACITIFPRLIDTQQAGKIGICAHEVQHLISQHSITGIVLIAYLTRYCSITENGFKQSKEYQDLAQIHEAQAEILPALRDPEIAHNLKALRKTHYYPQQLYEEHFYSLSTIDMLWKLHAKIQSLIH